MKEDDDVEGPEEMIICYKKNFLYFALARINSWISHRLVVSKKEYDERPEELINRYVRLRTATANIATGAGTLALLWSTVVLLGGFVGVLNIKEFWVLTLLSFVMAFRAPENYDEFERGIYWEEVKIFNFIGRHKWIRVGFARCQRTILGMVIVPKYIMFQCFAALPFNVMPFVGLGISVWRLVRRDYGNAGGDVANKAKLNGALDIFYALVLFQSLLILYWEYIGVMLASSLMQVARVTSKQCGGEKWIPKLVDMYCLETKRKLKKDGELPDRWNLITYGIELLQSASGDDGHRWGARVLDKLSDDEDTSSVRRELLSSRLSIQNLIGMIGRRGAADDDIEKRECAARIIARHANDLPITCFPGSLQCICSLLQSGCEQQVNSPWANPNDNQTHTNEKYHMVVSTTIDQNDEEQVVSSLSTGLANGKRTNFLQRFGDTLSGQKRKFRQELKEYSETKYRHLYKSMGAKELISQGLLILERLTQDEGNCIEISKDQRLLSIITSPLRNHDILIKTLDNTTFQVLSKALTVLSRLLTSHGDDITRLRQELASNKEVVSNLMAIMETARKDAQELHEQAMHILTELAFDDSFGIQEFNKFFNALLCIFTEEETTNTIMREANTTIVEVEQPERDRDRRRRERERAIRQMGNAGVALAKLLLARTTRGLLSEQEAINLSTRVFDQILSSEVGTTQGNNENQSKQTKFIAAMLFLAVVICNENEISKEYFARRTPKDTDLVKKLKEIVEANKCKSAECLRIVKLICRVVIAMIRVKPACFIQHLNEHNFRAALTEVSETMSEVDDCMLFDGNDREVIKPARSLASLVKEAQELLQTAYKQG